MGWLDDIEKAQSGWEEAYEATHPSVRSLRNDTMNRMMNPVKKEVASTKKDNTKTSKVDTRQESASAANKRAQKESQAEAIRQTVGKNMQKAYKHPLMQPGAFTPEGMAIIQMQQAAEAIKNTTEGDYKHAALNAGMAALPFAGEIAGGVKNMNRVGRELSAIEKEGVALGLSEFEIAKKQLQEVGITANQRKAYKPILSDFADKYITPRGYTNPNGKTKFSEIIDNIKKGGYSATDELEPRLDAWKLYLGKPQVNNTFSLADTAPISHPSYKPGSLKNMDIYNINNEGVTGFIPPEAPDFYLSNKQHLRFLENPISVDRDANIMGGYNRVLTKEGTQYNDIWDLEPEINFKSLVPSKISDSKALENLFWSKGPTGLLTPKKIKVPVDKFLGKPFMSHGNLPYTSTDHVNTIRFDINQQLNHLKSNLSPEELLNNNDVLRYGEALKELENYPKFQNGGKSVTVTSKNDPRYKAYQDSLTLSNLTEKQKPFMSKIMKGSNLTEAQLQHLIISETPDFTEKEAKARDRLKAVPVKVTPYSYKTKDNIKMSGTWSQWKKPHQPVIVDPSLRGTTTKTYKDSLTAYNRDKKNYESQTGLKYDDLLKNIGKDEKITYTEKGTPIYLSRKPKAPIVKEPIRAFSNELNPAGIHVDNSIRSEAIHNPTRVPRYYEIEDTSNPNAGFGDGYGGTRSLYRTDNPYTLPPADNRTVTPMYQGGGGWLDKIDNVMSAPARAATYATEAGLHAIGARKAPPKYENPSAGIGIDEKEHPYLAMATDLVLDPVNLVGGAAISKIGKLAKGVKTVEKTKQVWNMTNPILNNAVKLAEQAAIKSHGRAYQAKSLFSKSAADAVRAVQNAHLERLFTEKTVKALKLGAKDAVGAVALINDLIRQHPDKKEEILNSTASLDIFNKAMQGNNKNPWSNIPVTPTTKKSNTTTGKQVKKSSVPKPREKVVPVSQELSSVGDSDFSIGADVNIQQPTRVPKYYNVEDTSNPNAGFGSGYGGTKSSYRTNNPTNLPPADNRKVTPIYQDGGKSPFKLVPKEQRYSPIDPELADNAFVSQRDWMNSPMYEEMLKNSSKDPAEYDKIKKGRLAGWDHAEFEPNTQVLKDGILGEAFPEGNIKLSLLGSYDQTTYDHELSHATDTVRTPDGQIATYIPEKDINSMRQLLRKNLSKEDRVKYLSEPTEVRARINAIRAGARDQGVYDPYTDRMTEEQYLQAIEKGNAMPFQDLEEIYDPQQVLELINSVSQTNSNPSNNRIAQDGWWDAYKATHPSVRSMRNDVMNRKMNPVKKEVASTQIDNTSTPRVDTRQESATAYNKRAQRESQAAAIRQSVGENMQEAYKHPLMQPGMLTPEGMAIMQMQQAAEAVKNTTEGEYGHAAFNAGMSLLPFAGEAGKVLGTEEGLLSKAYKINPWAVKENPEKFLYRAQPVDFNPINDVDRVRAKIAAGEPVPWHTKHYINAYESGHPKIKAQNDNYGKWFEENPERLDFYLNSGDKYDVGTPMNILRTKLPKAQAKEFNVANFPEADILSASSPTEYVLPSELIAKADKFPAESWDWLIQQDKAFNKPHWLNGFKAAPEAKAETAPIKDLFIQPKQKFSNPDAANIDEPFITDRPSTEEPFVPYEDDAYMAWYSEQKRNSLPVVPDERSKIRSSSIIEPFNDEAQRQGFTWSMNPFGKLVGKPLPEGWHRKMGSGKGIQSMFESKGIVSPTDDHLFFSYGKKPNENYKGVYSTVFDTSKSRESMVDDWRRLHGPRGRHQGSSPLDAEGNSITNLPIEDPAVSVHRRFPFTNSYQEIPKEAMLNGPRNFREELMMNPQLATMQKYGEDIGKFALWGSGAQEIGHQAAGTNDKDKYPLGIPMLQRAYEEAKPLAKSIYKGWEDQWKHMGPQQQDGGIIEDQRGQWAHPLEDTRIRGENGQVNITMRKVNYPVLGISNTGERQMMYPDGEYEFSGDYVDEYPKPELAQNGLVRLNQLTNFTNYNKPQPGGWLSKYK